MTERPSRDTFYLWLTVAIAFSAYLGFSFTYFAPITAGEYPDVSPTVHLHARRLAVVAFADRSRVERPEEYQAREGGDRQSPQFHDDLPTLRARTVGR